MSQKPTPKEINDAYDALERIGWSRLTCRQQAVLEYVRDKRTIQE